MVPRNRQNGRPEARGGTASAIRELVLPAAMAEIAARDHELGLKALDQDRGAALDRLVVPRSVMEVGQV